MVHLMLGPFPLTRSAEVRRLFLLSRSVCRQENLIVAALITEKIFLRKTRLDIKFSVSTNTRHLACTFSILLILYFKIISVSVL